MAMLVLKELTPRATLLDNICKSHTTLKPEILMHEIKREKFMTVWFKGDEIPIKEQRESILNDLNNLEGVEMAMYDHVIEGESVSWTIWFAE